MSAGAGVTTASILTLHVAAGAIALLAGGAALSFQKGSAGLKDGFPAPPYFIFGSVALFGAAGDFRLIRSRSIRGAPRIARHLWRMCFALFIASSALFLGQAQLFPAVIRQTPALWILGFLPLFLLAYWVVRVRFTGWYGRSSHES